MLTTLVYKLTGQCEKHMKNEKLAELLQLICPTSSKEAIPCRYAMHAVCDQRTQNVKKHHMRSQGVQWVNLHPPGR